MGDVSSGNAGPTLHPAGPGMLAQKIYQVKVALNEADKTAAIIVFYHSP